MLIETDSLAAFLATAIFLYAETHYSFKGIYSRFKKREPEIVVDAPHRIDPGHRLPVLLLVKDAHRYPIRLRGVEVTTISEAGSSRGHTFELNGLEVAEPFWWRIFEVTPPPNGQVSVDVTVDYLVGAKERRCHNDNHVATSHAPLSTWVASDPLPCDEGWLYGDLHTHSSYTSDQVEFGAPLEPSVHLAQALGLRFFAVTDHSYDLDDHHDDYTRNDPDLAKWHAFWTEVEELNRRRGSVTVLGGEEVSCGNARGRNIHFLILNSHRFFPGSGDSAERWFRNAPEMSLEEILEELEPAALAVASHPSALPPFLERRLIRRGHWQEEDCRHRRLDGMQIWNGSDTGLQEGLDQWVRCLLAGQKIFLYGGNDAHGNFNRFRQIGFPFFTMREHHDHLFGKVRTAVHVPGPPDVERILTSLRMGNCIVTDGPFVRLEFVKEDGTITPMGSSAAPACGRLRLYARSTSEFGPLQRIAVCRGVVGSESETVEVVGERNGEAYAISAILPVEWPFSPTYLRAFVESGNGDDIHRGFTNPVWVG